MYPEAKPQRVLFNEQWSLDFILQGLNIIERFCFSFHLSPPYFIITYLYV